MQSSNALGWRKRDMHETKNTLGRESARVRAHYAQLAATYEERANPACKRACEALLRRTLSSARRILELGAGSGSLLGGFPADCRVACDLSHAMLCARPPSPGMIRAVGDAQRLPFADASFDAAFCINVLEHIPDPECAVAEAARVLTPGGRFLTVTPNGGVEWLLDILERLHLKLPEGPHRFLTFAALSRIAGERFRVVEHRQFLAFPAGPAVMVRAIDRMAGGAHGRGLFQYLLAERQ